MSARSTGAWLVFAAAVIGLAVAAADYLMRGSGIDHTPGALLVVISTALLAAAAAALALLSGPGWLRATLTVLVVLDLAGTGLAGWFLHAWLLVSAMILGAFGAAMLASGRGFSAGEPAS